MSRQNRNVFILGDTFLANEPPEPDWLIQDLWPGMGISYLAGRSRSGKSCLALQMAKALTVGEGASVIDCPIIGPSRRVLMVQSDCSKRELWKQWKKIVGPTGDRFSVLFLQRYWMGDPGLVKWVQSHIDTFRPDIIQWDSWNTCASLEWDLNTREDTGRAWNLLEKLTGDRAALLLAHNNKDGEKQGSDRVAGHHSLPANASGQLHLARGVDKQEADLYILTRDAGEPHRKIMQEKETGKWYPFTLAGTLVKAAQGSDPSPWA